MNTVFRTVEDNRKVIIPESVRLFLAAAVLESLTLHQEAWRSHTSRVLNARNDSDAGALAEIIQISLTEVLDGADAEPRIPNGVPEVTHIGVPSHINRKWCGIFPICR